MKRFPEASDWKVDIEANPWILKITLIGVFISVAGLFSGSYLSLLIGSLITIVLTGRGSGTFLLPGGMQYNHFAVQWSDLERVYQLGQDQLVMVRTRGHKLRIKRWHFTREGWHKIQMHLRDSGLPFAEISK